MRTFVISLAGASDRRGHMAAQLEGLGLDFEFFEAIDGRRLSEQEVARVYDDEKARQTSWGPLNRGEIGCALSHVAVWRRLCDENLPWALVLEDDAVVDPATPEVLAALPGRMGSADLVALVKTNDNTFFFHRAALPGHRSLVYVNQPFYTAAGYVITRGAAERLARRALPLSVPIDFWYHETGFRGVTPIRAVHPPLVSQASPEQFPSQIGGREVQLQAKSPAGRRSSVRQRFRALRLVLKNRFLNWPATR